MPPSAPVTANRWLHAEYDVSIPGTIDACGASPGRRLRNPDTIVYDRAQPHTLRITVVFLRNTWLSITIVILRVVYGRS